MGEIHPPTNHELSGAAPLDPAAPAAPKCRTKRESWEKLPFYAAHDVDEILIVDPEEHAVHWLRLSDGEYRVGGPSIARSTLIDLGPSELAEQIDWP